jgi:ATP-dependent Clp protease adaptor protein ClpS
MARKGLSEDIATKDRVSTKEPPMYKVLLLNDDYTTMEFVVMILETVFKKTPAEAEQLMLTVHERGHAIAGVFTKEIAETKIALVHHLARQSQYPLKCTMEVS